MLSFLVLPPVNCHLPLIPNLILRRLLIPILPLLLGQRLEMPGNDLGNFSKLGLGIGGLDVVTRGVRVEEEAGLVSLGGVGVLLLLLLLALLGGVAVVAVGVGIGGGGFVVFHFALVAFLVFHGELIPSCPLGFRDFLEFGGEELRNITKLGIRILLLHPLTIRIRIQKERGHIALGAVGILILLLLTAALGLDDLLFFLLDGVDIFFVGAHDDGGYGG
mmetsp:Transcript_41747/g.87603  ORF Transcript_41747/g.87603 Transcript_41747/m.87603 type:complete len:219 (-) Transcript_41747:260-916(-)